MEVLYFLEGIRTPIGDSLFSLLTHLGEETVFILIGLLFFWCINKKEGYYLLSVGLIGTVLNQFLKLLFRIPRPWVKDENFTIVESARAEATGYSFPSGHTQSAVGSFGAIARWNKSAVVRIFCIAACVLVPLSRMYLGVHTPADVGVSIFIALALVFGLYPIVHKASGNKKGMRILMLCMTLLAIGYLVFVLVFPFPVDVDLHNLQHGTKNAFTMLGCVLALWLSFEVDERFLHFDTKAIWWAQILKLVLGFLLMLAIRSGLKAPLTAIIGNSYVADGIRYFFMTAFAGCVWPMTFPLFSKLCEKKK